MPTYKPAVHKLGLRKADREGTIARAKRRYDEATINYYTASADRNSYKKKVYEKAKKDYYNLIK